MSNAKLDLPEPDKPVITTNSLRGITTSRFFKLWICAPFIRMFFLGSRLAISEDFMQFFLTDYKGKHFAHAIKTEFYTNGFYRHRSAL